MACQPSSQVARIGRSTPGRAPCPPEASSILGPQHTVPRPHRDPSSLQDPVATRRYIRHPGGTSCATHFQNEARPLGLNQTPPKSCVVSLSPAPSRSPASDLYQLRAHMFHRSQVKQQGFAKEQRVADAQLQSLRQLGLIGPETKGFASAWGGTEPIAESRPPSRSGPQSRKNYTIIPPVGDLDEPTFPEKGASISSPYSS